MFRTPRLNALAHTLPSALTSRASTHWRHLPAGSLPRLPQPAFPIRPYNGTAGYDIRTITSMGLLERFDGLLANRKVGDAINLIEEAQAAGRAKFLGDAEKYLMQPRPKTLSRADQAALMDALKRGR